jgi:F0F1-type ATP synthase beta subunit
MKNMATVLQELGLSYKETIEVMRGVSKDLRQAKDLWNNGHKSKLIKIACTLIAFPEPTPISECVGAAVLTVGLVQNRIKNSRLHIDDVYRTFQDVNKNLLRIRQE